MNHIKVLDFTKPKGRVFFTTDLHGHYELLHEKLREVAFDSTKDILICGGDWCDRGPDSQHVLDYLNEPWIHSVRANHEQMFIEAYEGDFKNQACQMLVVNGGSWVAFCEDDHLTAIYESFKSLPLAIEMHTPTEVIGIIHAQVPYNNWNEFKKASETELVWNAEATAMWSRHNYDYKIAVQVEGVDRVLVGHTPTESGEIEVLGNVHYCDLGSFFRNKISFIQLV